MHKSLVVFAFMAISTFSASPSLGSANDRSAPVLANSEHLQFVFPDNIDCKDFEKTAYKVWTVRDRSSVDLGNWDGSFWISGAISRGVFVRKGFDLLDLLEAKCGMSAR